MLVAERPIERTTQNKLVPFFIPDEQDIEFLHLSQLPKFNDYRPNEWELVGTITCYTSISSFTTRSVFLEMIEPKYGYAIIEEDNFRNTIGKFKKL